MDLFLVLFHSKAIFSLLWIYQAFGNPDFILADTLIEYMAWFLSMG